MIGMLSKKIVVSDGTSLHYLESSPKKKTAQTVIMIPGGGQPAETFKYQFEALHDQYHLIALDMRGHGDSSDPGFGYNVARFAKDLYDILSALNLENIVLLGHSLGASIIWSYWQLFQQYRLSKLVLIDESPFALINPNWSEGTRKSMGGIYTFESVFKMITDFKNKPSDQLIAEFIDASTTKQLSSQKKAWLVKGMLKMSMSAIADLFFDNITTDWHAIIPTIHIPTLIISGRCSLIPWESQLWIHEQIAKSQLEIFECAEGGSHFMFVENPDKFNYLLSNFISK